MGYSDLSSGIIQSANMCSTPFWKNPQKERPVVVLVGFPLSYISSFEVFSRFLCHFCRSKSTWVILFNRVKSELCFKSSIFTAVAIGSIQILCMYSRYGTDSSWHKPWLQRSNLIEIPPSFKLNWVNPVSSITSCNSATTHSSSVFIWSLVQMNCNI